MGPCAVDGELDLTPKVFVNILKGDFPNILGDHCHTVLLGSGIPADAVQPAIVFKATAVTDSKNALVFERGDLLNDFAHYRDGIIHGIVHDGKGACTGEVEGYILSYAVADPLCAVLDDLELDILVGFVNRIFLAVDAVGIQGHKIGFVAAVPTGAENVLLAARYDTNVGESRLFGGRLGGLLGGFLSRRLRGNERSGFLGRILRGLPFAAIPAFDHIYPAHTAIDHQVMRLVPLVVKVVCRHFGVHAAENHTVKAFGYCNRIAAVGFLRHVIPVTSEIAEEVRSKACSVGQPFIARLEFETGYFVVDNAVSADSCYRYGHHG